MCGVALNSKPVHYSTKRHHGDVISFIAATIVIYFCPFPSSIMAKLLPLIQLLPSLVFCWFYGLLGVALLVITLLRRGPKRFFSWRRRQQRPVVMDDPTLGTHQYVQLEVGITMTSWYGTPFCITGHLWGESIGCRCCYTEKKKTVRLTKQSRRRWFEMS